MTTCYHVTKVQFNIYLLLDAIAWSVAHAIAYKRFNLIFLYLSHSGEISKITAAVHIRALMKINTKHNNNSKN